MNRPRILIADDHRPIQERVRELVGASYEVVGAVDNGVALVEQAKRLRPDLIVLDDLAPAKRIP